MRIFVNIKINTYSRYRPHNSEIKSIVYTNSNIGNEVAKRIKELTVDTSTLPKSMKVYFDTYCKYPRYKLKNNADYRRVIKPANADIVVYTPVVCDRHHQRLWGKQYLANGEIHNIDPKFLKDKSPREFLGLSEDVVIEELKYATNWFVASNTGQSLHNLFHVYTKIITDNQLDAMLNSALMDMTDEEYFSIKEMLQSKDDETFKLGLKMLIGYNTNNNAVRIGTLLIEYCKERYYMLTDVNTTQILSILGITRKTIQYSHPYKTYIRDLVNKSTSDDDKSFARKFIINYVGDKLQEYQASLLKPFKDMDINADINIY